MPLILPLCIPVMYGSHHAIVVTQPRADQVCLHVVGGRQVAQLTPFLRRFPLLLRVPQQTGKFPPPSVVHCMYVCVQCVGSWRRGLINSLNGDHTLLTLLSAMAFTATNTK